MVVFIARLNMEVTLVQREIKMVTGIQGKAVIETMAMVNMETMVIASMVITIITGAIDGMATITIGSMARAIIREDMAVVEMAVMVAIMITD